MNTYYCYCSIARHCIIILLLLINTIIIILLIIINIIIIILLIIINTIIILILALREDRISDASPHSHCLLN